VISRGGIGWDVGEGVRHVRSGSGGGDDGFG